MKPPSAKAIAPMATPVLPPRKVEALTTPEPLAAGGVRRREQGGVDAFSRVM